jgi:hypothetical protein
VHPGQIYEWARTHVPVTAEAVFIGGNGFRAIGVIQALEEDLKRPVSTANQVAFWQALRLSGTHNQVVGYGELFAFEVPGFLSRGGAERKLYRSSPASATGTGRMEHEGVNCRMLPQLCEP